MPSLYSIAIALLLWMFLIGYIHGEFSYRSPDGIVTISFSRANRMLNRYLLIHEEYQIDVARAVSWPDGSFQGDDC